jgi:hypothetical protein
MTPVMAELAVTFVEGQTHCEVVCDRTINMSHNGHITDRKVTRLKLDNGKHEGGSCFENEELGL